MDEGLNIHAAEFLRRVPQHLAVGCVDFEIQALQVRDIHACDRACKRVPETLFTGTKRSVFRIALYGNTDHMGRAIDQRQIFRAG